MRIGIYGGSFDPIHNGHLVTANFVLEERNLNKILFIPAYISPHKLDMKYSPASHRMKMIQLAIEDKSEFSVSDIEINNESVSYTYSTLLELSKIYNEMELIIGYDNFLVFDKWTKPELILDLVKLIVLRRHKIDYDKPNHKFRDYGIVLNSPIIDISSSDIRRRVNNNKSLENLVPIKVKNFIAEHNLYR
ncbi:MAG: nicotinate-nucleotide adenylyltransferase [Melioribacteraceae bacterium]|nr:nicotinate-nucleotide adenylyltransferase [Melioribacteraceae bacterium]